MKDWILQYADLSDDSEEDLDQQEEDDPVSETNLKPETHMR